MNILLLWFQFSKSPGGISCKGEYLLEINWAQSLDHRYRELGGEESAARAEEVPDQHSLRLRKFHTENMPDTDSRGQFRNELLQWA